MNEYFYLTNIIISINIAKTIQYFYMKLTSLISILLLFLLKICIFTFLDILTKNVNNKITKHKFIRLIPEKLIQYNIIKAINEEFFKIMA